MQSSATNSAFIVQQVDKFTVVEFRVNSLMDPIQLDQIGKALYHLVDAEDKRKIVLDFEKVQYISSQAIGILLQMHKKLSALKNSSLTVCSVGDKLMQLIKIVRLDKLLRIKPTQAEAVKQLD